MSDKLTPREAVEEIHTIVTALDAPDLHCRCVGRILSILDRVREEEPSRGKVIGWGCVNPQHNHLQRTDLGCQFQPIYSAEPQIEPPPEAVEEVARWLHREWFPRPVDKHDDLRAANQWLNEGNLFKEAFRRQARAVLARFRGKG